MAVQDRRLTSVAPPGGSGRWRSRSPAMSLEREVLAHHLQKQLEWRMHVGGRLPRRSYPLLNQVQVVDHMRGTFYAAVDTLGAILVEGPEVEEADALLSSHSIMRTDAVLEAELAEFRPHFDRPVDHELLLTVDIEGLPILVQQFISIDTIYRPPVEWTDGMPNMNWLSTVERGAVDPARCDRTWRGGCGQR